MYQILTDSECDLPLATLKDSNVDTICFHTKIGAEDIYNDFGQSYDIEEFYQKIQNGIMPTTTQVNIGEYLEFFKPYVEKKIPIVYIGFSGGLSGSLASAKQAKDILLESFPEATIEIIDTAAASGGEGLLVLQAIRLQKAGKSLQDVVDWFDNNKLRLRQWFTVDNLNYLYHGGRISHTSATLGTLLKVKPILDIDDTGKLRMIEKTRTRKKSLVDLANRVIPAIQSNVDQPIIITTSGDYEAAQIVKNKIQTSVSEADIQIYPIGMTISSHTGFGCVAVFAMGLDSRQ